MSVLPEEYAFRGVYAYTPYADNDFRVVAKWVFNALYAAEEMGMNKDNAMQIIEEERVKELYMEGFRLMDLKRWHKGFERKEQQNSLPEGSSLKIEKDNPLFVWPIPNHELESPDANIKPNKSNS